METNERRYDIDWLRVIAIALLLIYHAVISFQPWGVFFGFIQNEKSIETLWIPMSMLNVWRIPLLFFVSGMGVCFAMKKRSWKQLISERSRRILLPLLFGMFVIVPLHVLIWQNYYSQDLAYQISRGHLWFLGNIFVYVLLLFPVFYYLSSNSNNGFMLVMQIVFQNPFGILVVILPFVLETFIVNPESFEIYAMTWHGFYIGLLAFSFGFLFVKSGSVFWATVLKWRWLYVTVAIFFYFIRLLIFELEAPSYLVAIESVFWLYAVFGFAYKYLNKGSAVLSYLSKAAYPIYIVHMIFQYLACVWIMPLDLPVSFKLMGVIAISFIGSYLFYELFIRRIKLVRLFFGG